ncbi:MAG TPA: lectin, partial [Actinospica sp.]|nr:lectin [Actinospica sp.]
AYCNSNGIDYQPCVLPGDLSARQRVHGDFMWGQFYNMVRVGAQGIYISMFDEYGEGNQILNTAPTQQQVPAGSGLLSLDEDGTACSADYYLRLTNDGGRMLKRQIALTATRPTAPAGTSSGGGGGTGSGCGTMAVNQQITVNQSILSCDGRFSLVLGGDGNLVLYEGSTVLWSAGTAGKASTRAVMQGDGNFVIYNGSGSPVWASNTAGNNGATLLVQNDGNTVIYSTGGAALWSTNTAGH